MGGTRVPSAANQILEGDGGDLAHWHVHRPLHRHPQKAGHLPRRLCVLRGARNNRITTPPAFTRTTTDSACALLVGQLVCQPVRQLVSHRRGRWGARGAQRVQGRGFSALRAAGMGPCCRRLAAAGQASWLPRQKRGLESNWVSCFVSWHAGGRLRRQQTPLQECLVLNTLLFLAFARRSGSDGDPKELTKSSTKLAGLRQDCGTSGHDTEWARAGGCPSCRRRRCAVNSNGRRRSSGTRLVRALWNAT